MCDSLIVGILCLVTVDYRPAVSDHPLLIVMPVFTPCLHMIATL